jgi:hypothetical protein
MDGEMRKRKEMAQKAAKLGMFGKLMYDEAEAIREQAAAIIAFEMEEDEKADRSYLHKVVVKSLERELAQARKEMDEVRSKLMHHTSSRELDLEEECKSLRKRVHELEARTHWESTYGWTLPGAFILASEKDGCSCSRERSLYGAVLTSASAAALEGGSSSSGNAGGDSGRRGGGAAVRTCACGKRY